MIYFINIISCENEGLQYVLKNINPVKNLINIFNNKKSYDKD